MRMIWIATLAIIYLMLVVILSLPFLAWEIIKGLTGIGK
jgi:hypothetical protein